MTDRSLIPVEDCLQAAIDAVGTLKQVGEKIWPPMNPVAAGKKLAHCIGQHAQRFDYDEERHVWILAREVGAHEGFRQYAESIGYRIEPMDTKAEIAAIAHRAERMAEQATNLSNEVLERMKAAGLKVES